MDTKPFIYDEPRPYLMRLFKLDQNAEDEPLSGVLMSMINWESAWTSLKLNWFLKSFGEDTSEIMRRLGNGEGYDALSYSWGTPKETYPLMLSTLDSRLSKDGDVVTSSQPERNGVLRIQPSLYEFLLEIRRRKHNRFIWIDAICIDQSSLEDKDNQIPLMKDIYENAQSVIVWLGEATNQEKLALNTLGALTEKLTAVRDAFSLNPENPTSFESMSLPLPTDEIWSSLRIILTKGWWSRLWVLQEVVVAKADPTLKDSVPVEHLADTEGINETYEVPNAVIMCGNATISWYILENFAVAASRASLEEWIITGHWGVLADQRHAFDAIREVRTCRENFAWSVPLRALLLATRRRIATLPVDIVIGQSALLDRYVVKHLALKSSQPVEHVFTTFAKHYIRQEPKECLLNHISTCEIDLNLPSWCPNFASSADAFSLGSRWLGHYDSPPEHKAQMYHAGFNKKGKWSLPRSKLYYAKYLANPLMARDSLDNQYATKNPRQIQLVPNSNSILLSGVDCDEVTEVIPCNQGAEGAKFLAFNSIEQTFAWDLECTRLARATLSEDLNGFDVYARTLTANRVAMYPTSDTKRIFDPHNEIDFVGPYLGFKRFMQATLDAGESIAEEGNISVKVKRYIRVLERITKRRTFFATRRGNIGIGPSDAKVGDRLVVAFYTPTPFLIRQSADHITFKMIGETYVHGLMYGEVLEMVDKRKVQESKWVIS